jgi:hypothetical protein
VSGSKLHDNAVTSIKVKDHSLLTISRLAICKPVRRGKGDTVAP